MRQFFNSMPRQRALHRLHEPRSWFFFPEQSTVVSRKRRMNSFSTLPSIFFLAIIRFPSFFDSVLMLVIHNLFEHDGSRYLSNQKSTRWR